jgi:hypothetical protein
MIEVIEKGRKVTCAELEQLVHKLGAKLPEDYRLFLERENGGIPVPNIIDIDGLPGTPTDVQVLFGIGRNVRSSDLAWNLDFISDRALEYRLLPIARDSGGGLFCLLVDQEAEVGVVYCDFRESFRKLYPVAPSFTEFTRKIRD